MPVVRHISFRLLSGRHRSPARRRPPPVAAADARPAVSARAPGLVVGSSYSHGCHRIDVDGQLHLGTVELLDAAVAGAYRPTPRFGTVPTLVLDLTDVTFLDAVAVTALRRIHDLAQGYGTLRIGIPVRHGPRRLLRLAAYHGWLPPSFRPDGPCR
jgi:hypothetical protein